MRRSLAALLLLTTLAAPALRAATPAPPPAAVAFTAPLRLPGPDRCRAVAVADVTGDGHKDVVVAGYEDAQITVYPGTGDGLFAAARTIPIGHSHVVHIVAGDVNGDGAADLVIDGQTPGTIEALVSDGVGGLVATAYPPSDPLGTYDVEVPALIDWNGDGPLDLLTVGPIRSRVRLNDGSGRFGASIVAPFGPATDVLVADLDGDTRADVFLQLGAAAQVHWGVAAGTFAPGQPLPGESETHIVAGQWPQAADLDADGYLDVVGNDLWSGRPPSFAGVARHVGPRGFAATPYPIALWRDGFQPRPEGVALADLNADGSPDIVTSVGYRLNAGDGTFGDVGVDALIRGHLGSPLPITGYAVAAGDIDGDGFTEIVVTNDANVGGTYSATVYSAAPKATFISLASAAPSTLYQSTTIDVTLTGLGFKPGDVADFGAGITVNSTIPLTAASLVANVSVSSSAALGPRTVRVTNPDGGKGKLAAGVVVAQSGAATIGSVTPDHGHAGDTLNLALTGFGFIPDATATLGAGVTVNATQIVDNRHATMNVTIAADAALGLRDLTWTNGTGVQWTATNAFNVLRRRSIDLSLVSGRITKKKKAGHGTFRAAGGLAFNQASADGLFDPTKDAVRVRFGDPSSPSVVDVAAGSKWRIKGGRFTWKTDKKTKGPRVALTINLERHSFVLSVAGYDVAPDAAGDVSLDVALGDDYGVAVRQFAPTKRRGYVLR